MRLWSRIRTWLRASFSRSRAELEMDAELRFHVEAYMEDLVREGVPQGEAARRARLEFGGMDRTKEECREARGANLLEDLLQDLRYGARALRKSPAFTSIAVLTLALGIGANTAIFTLLDAVFFRSLPARDPQELVLLQWHAHKSPKYDEYSSFGYCAEGGGKEDPWGCSFSSPMYDSIRAQASVFEGTVAFGGPAQLNLSGNGPASMVSGNIVSGDFFQTLGIHAARGRLLEPSDDMATAPPVVALGYGYWQSAFGGSDSAIGQNINLNGVSFTIVGVAEAKFPSLAAGKKDEMWIPRSAFPDVGPHLGWSRLKDAGNSWMVIVGRLKPGVSVAQAQEAVSIIFRNELSYGSDPLLDAKYEPSILLLPAQNGLIHGTGVQQPLYILMVAVGILLLIACANVAGLLLARSGARSKEMAVRLALGASRARLARQLLTESLLLSFFGGVVGILVAYWGVHATTVLLSGGVSGSFPFPVAPNLRILAFTVAGSILSGVFFGLAPAMRSTRLDLTPALKE